MKPVNSFVFALFISLCIAGCSRSVPLDESTQGTDVSEAVSMSEESSVAAVTTESMPQDMAVDYGQGPITMYGYQCLFDDAERKLYSTIDQHVKELVPSPFTVDVSIDVNRLQQIIDIYTLDHPEVFWIDEALNVESHDAAAHSYCLRYNCREEELEKRKQEMEEEITRFLDSIPKDASDFDKELMINDYLVDLCEYDSDAPKDDVYVARNEIYSYGALIDHLVNCEGYSKAAKLLLDRVGINNVLVSGVTPDNLPHIWNAVELAGDWYYLDVTNNDVESPDVPDQFRHHIYFNVTEQHYHLIESIEAVYGGEVNEKLALHNLFVPECTAVEENYFYKTCEQLSTSDYQKIVQKTADAAKAGEDHFAFIVDEDSDYEDFWRWLYDDGHYRDLVLSVNQLNEDNPKVEIKNWPNCYKSYRVIWINLDFED